MLASCLFIICSFTLVYLKVIANIQLQLRIITIIMYYWIKSKKTFPSNMIAFLVIYKISITVVQIQDIAKTKIRLQQFYLEKCFIQQGQENIWNAYFIKYITLLQLVYIGWEWNNIHHSMFTNPQNKNIYIHKY